VHEMSLLFCKLPILIIKGLLMRCIVFIGLLIFTIECSAHGIAGNRLFPGTLTFDDPAVADELTGPFFSFQKHPTPEGNEVRERLMGLSFSRLLTESTAIGVDSEYTEHRDPAGARTQGVGATHLFLKHQLYANAEQETLLAGGLALGLGGVGRADLHAHTYDTIEPGISFGVGLGDLPDAWSFFRPFALTGSVVADFPLSSHSSPTPGAASVQNPIILHTGFAIEFSPLYLSQRFKPGVLPDTEPLHQFIPLIEFQFDTPLNGGYGRQSSATMNPGVAYVSETWQASIEWIVPLNTLGGSSGVRAGVIFFLDDAIPSLFSKPVFSHPSTQF